MKIMNVLKQVAISVEPVSNSRMAAAIVYKRNIIAIGTNKYKSHPFQKKYEDNPNKIYLHAEKDVILNAIYEIGLTNISKSILYVCRVKWNSTNCEKFILGNAKPCKGCMNAIIAHNIKHVYYTDELKGICKL